MLVLSRKVGEQIHVGNDVTITIVRTNSTNVRIGIDAPREKDIVRAELVPDTNEQPATQPATEGVATTGS